MSGTESNEGIRMKTISKRSLVFASVLVMVALLSGCQPESTTPPTTTDTSSKMGSTAPAAPPNKTGGAMSTDGMPAPAGADTSLKGGMK